MHRVRAHHVVGPRRHAGKPVTFEDVAYVGVGQRLRRSSFFCTPNQVGPVASGTCARIVPRPGGKYSCSREYRLNSGSLPSNRSQLATTGPLPIWYASYALPLRRLSPTSSRTLSSLMTAVFNRSPLPEKYRPTAGGIGPSSGSERCRITGVAPAPAASTTIFASMAP